MLVFENSAGPETGQPAVQQVLPGRPARDWGPLGWPGKICPSQIVDTLLDLSKKVQNHFYFVYFFATGLVLLEIPFLPLEQRIGINGSFGLLVLSCRPSLRGEGGRRTGPRGVGSTMGRGAGEGFPRRLAGSSRSPPSLRDLRHVTPFPFPMVLGLPWFSHMA
jgi:hypothetical protein